jgi:hypothetical protein
MDNYFRCISVFKGFLEEHPKSQDSLFQRKFFHGDLQGLGIAGWARWDIDREHLNLGFYSSGMFLKSQDTRPSLFIFLPRPRLQLVFVVDQLCEQSRTLDT